jgi:hypothetical protein
VLPGALKKARHLLLFDFSLSSLDPKVIEAGTPAYRDPFLVERGHWDEAADRYAAAVTLYEMLTGLRPRYGSGEAAAVATHEEATLEAERFDASVRDRMVQFFAKAFARDVAQRHETADAMRDQWLACFRAEPEEAGEEPRPPPDQELLASLEPATSIEALPLSARAKNALDRSGIITLGELLELPKNHLSGIRGVGRDTAREIIGFVELCRKAAQLKPGEGEACFCPDYRGPDGRVESLLGLPEGAAAALEDAGLGRVFLVAAAPKSRVERVLAKVEGASAKLLAILESESRSAAGGEPATIEAWIEALLPPARRKNDRRAQHVRLAYGLEALEGARRGDVAAIAHALSITRQAIYISLGKAREQWSQHPFLATLRERVTAALTTLGDVASVHRTAEALPTFLPHAAGQADDPEAPIRAAALVRVIGDVSEGLVLERIRDEQWLAAGPAHIAALRKLGAAGDELAGRDPLPSSEEVLRALSDAVQETPLASLPAERLVALAADASARAARSARLELYPRGMAAARAAKLCMAALVPAALSPDEMKAIVAARYPEAEPLPPRPGLDRIAEQLGLVWSEERQRYLRPAVEGEASQTQALSPRCSTTHTSHRLKLSSPQSQEASDFEANLKLSLEKRYFRLLEVNAAYVLPAVEQLTVRLGVEPRSLEQELIATARELMVELEVDEAAVFQADRDGPAGEAWGLLRDLMEKSADRLATRLLGSKEPLVLTEPGLLARYGLSGFVDRLVAAAQEDGTPPIFLVVPALDDSGPAPIQAVTGNLSVQTTSPAQRVRVPPAWIKNLHRGGIA